MPLPNVRLKSAIALGLLFVWANLSAFAHEVIGYLPDYRATPQTLRTLSTCTDVVYFGGSLGEDGSIVLARNAATNLPLIRAALKGSETRLILCLGGWKNDVHFPAVVASKKARDRFAASLKDLVSTHHFAGLDLDWEYPRDEEQWLELGALIKTGKASLGSSSFLWSVAVNPRHTIPKQVVAQLDRIHLMTYDAGKLHCDPAHAEAAISEWTKRGVPSSKLCIGVAFYGRHQENRNETKAYGDLFELYGSEVKTSQTAGGFYYDNPASCKLKRSMVADKKLRGLIIWELGQDASGEDALLPLLP